MKVQQAVDSIRISYEKNKNRIIPSTNILIETPTDNIFVSSVPEGVTPVTKDTYFRFASNTKNFTSASILKMQQDGWLNIKSGLTENIPCSIIPYIPDTKEFDLPNKMRS